MARSPVLRGICVAVFVALGAIAFTAVSELAQTRLPQNYQTLPATKKMELLWNLMTQDQYNYPTDPLPLWSDTDGIITALVRPLKYLAMSYLFESDEMPAGRRKLVHATGVCAKARWVIEARNHYTGAFRYNYTAEAVIRISDGSPIAEAMFQPGMAIKLLRDNLPSVNFHGLVLEGEVDDPRLFSHSLTTASYAPHSFLTQFISSHTFKATIDAMGEEDSADRPGDESRVPLYEAASANIGVNQQDKANDPFVLAFVPATHIIGNKALEVRAESMREDLLERVNPASTGSTPLYDIFAFEKLGPSMVPRKSYLGNIMLTSPFIASKFCDEGIFFRHQRLRHKRELPMYLP